MFKTILTLIFIYIFAFIILYNNGTYIAGIKISHLWKMFLIYIFIIMLCMRWRKLYFSAEVKVFILVSLIYVFWPLMSALLMPKPQDSFFFIGQRLLPVLFLTLLCTVNIPKWQADRILLHICLFFLLAALPFLTGLLAPLQEYVGTGMLDIEGINGFVGIHQKAHNASLVFMLLSIIALISASELKGKRRLIFLGLTSMLVFIVFKTYVRSGMLGLVIGVCSYLIFYRTTKLPNFAIMGLLGISLVLTGAVNIPGLSERLMAENKYQDTVDINSISSGRMIIWASSLQTFEDASLYGKLVGVGRDNVMDGNESRMGARLFPHCGYIDALVSFGLIGLIIYCWVLIALFNTMKKGGDLRYRYIGMIAVIGLASYSLFQSTDFPIPIMIMMVLVRLNMPNVDEESTTVH